MFQMHVLFFPVLKREGESHQRKDDSRLTLEKGVLQPTSVNLYSSFCLWSIGFPGSRIFRPIRPNKLLLLGDWS